MWTTNQDGSPVYRNAGYREHAGLKYSGIGEQQLTPNNLESKNV
jgi:hypothetical protein